MSVTFHALWARRHRRALRDKFAAAHAVNARLWSAWWDHDAPTSQTGEWAGMAQDLKESPARPLPGGLRPF